MLTSFPSNVIKKVQQWQRRSPLQLSRENETSDEWNTKAIQSLIKKLKEKRGDRGIAELEVALSSQSADSACVTLPRTVDGRLQIASRKAFPHLIYCRIFRYPDLISHNQIQSIDKCQWGFHAKKDHVCINPYHYERISPSPAMRPVLVKKSLELLPPVSELASPLGSAASPASAFLERHAAMAMFAGCSSPANYELQGLKEGQDCFLMNGQPVANSPVEGSSATSSEYGSDGSGIESSATSHLSQHRNSWTSDMSSTYSSDPTSSLGSQASTSSLESYPPTYSPPTPTNHVPYYQAGPLPFGPSGSQNYPDSSQNYVEEMDTTPVPFVEPDEWCSILYYEFAVRVGQPFVAVSKVIGVDGFTKPGDSERFCLGVLSNINRTPYVDRVREHIGKGVMLYYTAGKIYLHCVSDNTSVFVQSENLNRSHGWQPTAVIKVAPGKMLKVFDNVEFSHALEQSVHLGFEAVFALTKMCSIHISFVKGWGADYPRRQVRDTPCWIQVQLHGPLKWLDDVLIQMGSATSRISSVS
ncbi:hypothetical protein RvY_06062 [Ramazzottius varieornatus]|uniref:Mothers against decapentaplegic homolog n=1 Tax=Ramazzottius varieornatus TaxID=947166 RepID=A0A1D1UXQ7_RAMVA|nr:hypothetical protein RvY_06062 [Ramazzottius varieornatus]